MIHPTLDSDIKKARELIHKHENIALFTHADPDGDALGSISALDLALRRINKNVDSIISGTYSDNYNFLPLPLFSKEVPKKDIDLAIILDAANIERTNHHESILEREKIFLVNIDHHPQDVNYGHVNIVDPQATSTSELIFFLLYELGIDIDRDIASLLLSGIVSDTGSFKHANTTKRGLEISSHLIKRGGNIKNISQNTERHKKVSTIKLWGRVLSRIKSDREKGIVTSVITRADLEECGATKEDLEGVVNLISSIPNSKAALLLREDGGGHVKGSLRSEIGGLDVKKIAGLFGGGGHVRASGFKIKGKIKETQDGWEIIED